MKKSGEFPSENRVRSNFFQFVSVGENAEKKIWIKLYDNKYLYENFNSNFSLQNKQLQQLSQLLKTQRIKLYDNKYFYENFNSNFSLQNKKL